jgi:hypothetical protein
MGKGLRGGQTQERQEPESDATRSGNSEDQARTARTLRQPCEEIAQVLEAELALGNNLSKPIEPTGWPERHSHFGALILDFQSDPSTWPKGAEHSVTNDPHYGWYADCYCRVHGHLLVAGSARPAGR